MYPGIWETKIKLYKRLGDDATIAQLEKEIDLLKILVEKRKAYKKLQAEREKAGASKGSNPAVLMC